MSGSGQKGRAVLLLTRWRNLVDAISASTSAEPAAAGMLSELVELSDETDRFLDDLTDEIEVSA